MQLARISAERLTEGPLERQRLGREVGREGVSAAV
jgi:hypothetical protein